MKETFKRTLNAGFRNDRILGAGNPGTAHAALEIDNKVGALPPSTVIVQDAGDGKTDVAAINPIASMQAIGNPESSRSRPGRHRPC